MEMAVKELDDQLKALDEKQEDCKLDDPPVQDQTQEKAQEMQISPETKLKGMKTQDTEKAMKTQDTSQKPVVQSNLARECIDSQYMNEFNQAAEKQSSSDSD